MSTGNMPQCSAVPATAPASMWAQLEVASSSISIWDSAVQHALNGQKGRSSPPSADSPPPQSAARLITAAANGRNQSYYHRNAKTAGISMKAVFRAASGFAPRNGLRRLTTVPKPLPTPMSGFPIPRALANFTSQLKEYDEIIDVRSPSEFAEDHIPGVRASLNSRPRFRNAVRCLARSVWLFCPPLASRIVISKRYMLFPAYC